MKAKDVEIGKKVIYHPIIGNEYGEPAVITGEVVDVDDVLCCKISIRHRPVPLNTLEEI